MAEGLFTSFLLLRVPPGLFYSQTCLIHCNMFGALNRFIGRLDEAPREPRDPTGESTSFGFQVLRNKDPELPLEPWFDFIVGINGHPIVRGSLFISTFDMILIRYCRKTQTQTSLLPKSATAQARV